LKIALFFGDDVGRHNLFCCHQGTPSTLKKQIHRIENRSDESDIHIHLSR
jgi:hypothetical protein